MDLQQKIIECLSTSTSGMTGYEIMQELGKTNGTDVAQLLIKMCIDGIISSDRGVVVKYKLVKDMNEIEERKSFFVDGKPFATREAAEQYLKDKETVKKIESFVWSRTGEKKFGKRLIKLIAEWEASKYVA